MGLVEPQVAYVVKKTDKRRLNFIRNLFAEMGFEENELEMRPRTLLTFQAMDHALLTKTTEEEQLELLLTRHAMFVGPVSKG